MDLDWQSFTWGLLVALIIVFIWKQTKKDYFTNEELKQAVREAADSDLDYISFVAKIGSADVSPLDFMRLKEVYKKNALTDDAVQLVLTGRGYLLR